MTCNGIHLLELRHVSLAEATGSPFWHCKLSIPSCALVLVFALRCLFLLYHLGFDPRGILAYIFHQLPCVAAELGVFAGEFEVEAEGVHFGGEDGLPSLRGCIGHCRMRITRRVGICFDGLESQHKARVWFLRCAFLDFAGMHILKP